uniref:Uncharacterized protein n=1 Tax=Physcomitrium patens TaxID=3218 RepID=A0A2K1K0A4_PHYPA|nr:hypothetical protein PHYPA_014336 [Physcomitrium patens]
MVPFRLLYETSSEVKFINLAKLTRSSVGKYKGLSM